MPKRIGDETIYLAKQIVGFKSGGEVIVYDNRNTINIDPESIEGKVEIYERQVKDWFLSYGLELARNLDSGFVAMMIAISYIEGVEQYRNGESSRNRSKEYFIQGAIRIFQIEEVESSSIERLYQEVRNGLFHNGMSGGDLVINIYFESAIEFTDSRIYINPVLFMKKIDDDFDNYIKELRNLENLSLRNNFNRMYNVT